MSDSKAMRFDCVQAMRKVRDELSSHISDLSYEELHAWLREHEFTDPMLHAWAEQAAEPAAAADGTARRG